MCAPQDVSAVRARRREGLQSRLARANRRYRRAYPRREAGRFVRAATARRDIFVQHRRIPRRAPARILALYPSFRRFPLSAAMSLWAQCLEIRRRRARCGLSPRGDSGCFWLAFTPGLFSGALFGVHAAGAFGGAGRSWVTLGSAQTRQGTLGSLDSPFAAAFLAEVMRFFCINAESGRSLCGSIGCKLSLLAACPAFAPAGRRGRARCRSRRYAAW